MNACYANPTNTNNVLQEFNCLYYKVDNGLKYYSYKSDSQNIHVDIKNIKDNNPETKADINYLLGLCTDITKLWYVYPNNITPEMYESLHLKYPKLFRKIELGDNTARSQDAIVRLIHEANNKATELQKKPSYHSS